MTMPLAPKPGDEAGEFLPRMWFRWPVPGYWIEDPNSKSAHEYISKQEADHREAEAVSDAEDALWKRLNEHMPTLHFCRDWDFLLIVEGDDEFLSCGCGPFPLKYKRHEEAK